MNNRERKLTATAQELHSLYIDQRLPVREIANRFGVCRQSVRKALVREGIPFREYRQGERGTWIKEVSANKKYDYSEKPCIDCGNTKPLECFVKNKQSPDRHRARCKVCESAMLRRDRARNPEKYRANSKRSYQAIKNDPARSQKYKEYARVKGRAQYERNYTMRTYNLPAEEYQSMLEKQNGLCAICRKPEISVDPRTGRPRRLCVDHDHSTGKVRGLLCFKCNTNLALFENKDYMSAVRAYLEMHGGEK